ncbi:MAG: 50S ribosomal protein L31e [Thermoplasmata archaeon]|nr:50S ribosomal protein L31e [Euryarchaeota archaeon]RLF66887.1 MAG: 50S ribosomal protein L31e [Thermoplasmata archaeon]
MTVLERVYTIPLRKAKAAPRYKRAKKAAKLVREFIARHMKTKEELIWIDPRLNEFIWQRGAEKPPARIRVFARKLDDGTVEVKLYEDYVRDQQQIAAEAAEAEEKIEKEKLVEEEKETPKEPEKVEENSNKEEE